MVYFYFNAEIINYQLYIYNWISGDNLILQMSPEPNFGVFFRFCTSLLNWSWLNKCKIKTVKVGKKSLMHTWIPFYCRSFLHNAIFLQNPLSVCLNPKLTGLRIKLNSKLTNQSDLESQKIILTYLAWKVPSVSLTLIK